MNELTYKLTGRLCPRAALIAYSTEDNRPNKDYFLELRPIDDRGRMGEARPVTYDFMNEISRNYTEAHNCVPHGVVPPNLMLADVRKGRERYVWYDPPQRRMMYFKESLQIESALYNLPGVIYHVRGNRMDIYAYKGSKTPTARTELFRAPFFNVSGASVCLGSALEAEMPSDVDFSQFMACWERRFWLSEFSHLGAGGNPTKSNLVLVTKAARNAPFDPEELVPMNVKLQKLLR
mgnify:CR=1 FL=1